MNDLKKNLPGLGAAAALAVLATLAGKAVPIIGGAVFGILGGLLVASFVPMPKSVQPGLGFAGKKVLQAAIVVLGTGLGLGQVWATGLGSLGVILTTLTAALVTAAALGAALGVPFNLAALIGSGTAICGGSAIAAVAPVIEAEDKEVAYAVSTVFLFNVLAVLVFPPLGHLLDLSQAGFGLFAGTAINDTSSVVAAAYAYGEAAGDEATVVKLTRTLMIVPVAAAFVPITVWRKRTRDAHPPSLTSIFPWFILGFLAMSALNTAGVLPAWSLGPLKELGRFLIVTALAAIGLKTDVRAMVRMGARPALLGLATWAAVTASSLAVQRLTGAW